LYGSAEKGLINKVSAGDALAYAPCLAKSNMYKLPYIADQHVYNNMYFDY